MKIYKIKKSDIKDRAHCTKCHKTFEVASGNSLNFKGPCIYCGHCWSKSNGGGFAQWIGTNFGSTGSWENAKGSKRKIYPVCGFNCRTNLLEKVGIEFKYMVIEFLVVKEGKHFTAVGRKPWIVVQSTERKNLEKDIAKRLMGEIDMLMSDGYPTFDHIYKWYKLPSEEYHDIRREGIIERIKVPVAYPTWNKEKLAKFRKLHEKDRRRSRKVELVDD